MDVAAMRVTLRMACGLLSLRVMKVAHLAFLGVSVLSIACGGSDDDDSGSDDGGAGAAGGGAGGAAGAAGTAGASGMAGASGAAGAAGAPMFGGDPGLPMNAPWGPSFIGAQSHVDDTGAPDDVALGVVWDESQVWVEYVGGDCIGFGTYQDTVVGQDVGTVTINGGSGVAAQALTRNSSGYYYLEEDVDAWSPGDSLSLDGAGFTGAPATVPTAITSSDIDSVSVSRSAPLTVTFSGTDASSAALTIAGGNEGQSYLLACISPAAGGTITVPADALASFPSGITGVGLKLSPSNVTQAGELAFIAAGTSVEADHELVD